MATCEKCGKTYYTKECLNCKNMTEAEIRKIKKSKINIPLIITISISIITIGIGTIIYKKNNNPLIGTWKSNKNIMGMGKIEFKEKRKKIVEADLIERKKLAESAFKQIKNSNSNFENILNQFI